MKIFIKKTLGFLIFPIISIVIWVLFYGFPPPDLSTDISFNAKMLSIKEKNINYNLNVIAVGSSMSLNNIYTKSIVKNYGSKYLNISSWGQTIEEDFRLIRIFAMKFKPTTIIISSNYMDFRKSTKQIKFEKLNKYLLNDYSSLGTDLRYFFESSRILFKRRHDNNYESLKYDVNGGVNYDNKDFKIISRRWIGNSIEKYSSDITQYIYLDSISNFCKVNDIFFVFIQSPFREGYFSQLNDKELGILDNHIYKINSILNKKNQLFINTLFGNWPDELFVDYSHLNAKGAEIYTELFLEKINKARTQNSKKPLSRVSVLR